jgi:hypothetical protein
MPFATVCPNCDARLTAPDAVRGKKVKCKKCNGAFVARPAADPEEDEDARPAKAAARSRRDEDDEPRPKGKKKGKGKKKKGSPVLLFVLVGVGALVLIGGGLGVYFGFIKEDKPKDTPVAQGDGAKGPLPKAGSGEVVKLDITWVDYSAPDGTFTAKFPKEPTHSTPMVQGPDGPIPTDLYAVSDPQFVAVAVTADLPGVPAGQPIPQQAVDQALEAACNAMVQQVPGGQQVSRTTISHQGNAGRDVVIAAPNGSGGTARVFIANGKIYNLLFAAKAGKPDPATVSTFFDGFKLQS